MSSPDLGDDDALLAHLAGVIDEDDPIPTAALDAAMSGFELHRIDEQMAALVDDDEIARPLLFRRASPSAGAMKFVADSLTIEMELDEREDVLIGALVPPLAIDLELETMTVQSGRRGRPLRSDHLGRFRTAVTPGLYRLRCHLPGTEIVTPWFRC
jgi:hypothetical protein